jgi:hypothetical protein
VWERACPMAAEERVIDPHVVPGDTVVVDQ